MADQLSILPSGQVIPTSLHLEVQQSYLEYAMSVIVGRALPDVRDGLKPVHRRILYAMHELGLTPDRPYRKCARVVGDVLGKYHPHGDQSVYDALVRMVQDFSSRYPLLEGHGNFGSVDDDPPAAMRYTETRLASVGNEGLLTEIGEATVDFTGNFDNSQQEPIVLPAQLPFLLLNGCSGIAVGMATNIPPHNLGEVVDGLIALIDRPDLPDAELFRLIPGPDFPTGGEIIGSEGIRDAYATGRGSVAVRGVARMEEVTVGRGRHRRMAIVVTELPFQVNKAGWIEKIADLTNQGRIEGIIDIRDESDREGMRVVIELKRDAQPSKVLSSLHKLTPLQNNFGVIMLAIANGQPRQMPLRELLQNFLDFREETLTRQYTHELSKAENRAHILEGQLIALDNLDTVIDILRNAPDGTTAKMEMMGELDFSDRQADSILAMPLRRLTGLERQNLQTEFGEINQRMEELRTLLNNRKELLKALKKDLRSLKKKYADPRRTRILSAAEQAEETAQLAEIAAEEIAAEAAVLEFSQRGYLRRLTPKAYQKQKQKQEEIPSGKLIDSSDFATEAYSTIATQQLLILTRSGKAYPVNIGDIPPTPRQSRGTPVVTLLPQSVQGEETIVGQFILPDEPEDFETWFIILLTQQGRMKRLPLSEFANMTGRGLTVIKTKEDDELAYALQVQVGDQCILGTTGGRVLRFQVDDEQIPVMSRSAQGVQIIRLRKGEALVGCVALGTEDDMLLVSAQGYAKCMEVKLVRAVKRGDLGIQGIQFANKTDTLVAIAPAFSDTEVTLITNEDHMIKFSIDHVPQQGREGSGDRLVKLTKKEVVNEVAIVDVAVEEVDAEE
jgi:DNA gyrase subunit A